MNGLLVFVVIALFSAAIGAVSQWLKAQKQAEEERQARAAAPARSMDRDREQRAKPDAIFDRYAEEIERLRRRRDAAAGGITGAAARQAKPPEVPVAKPTKSKRINASGDPTFATAAAPVVRAVPTMVVDRTPTVRPTTAAPPRVEDLPVAPVVSAGPIIPPLPPGSRDATTVAIRTISAAGVHDQPSEFAAALTALLRSPRSVPMAVVLHEVFGPRKGDRGRG